jgi:hypothetical protein
MHVHSILYIVNNADTRNWRFGNNPNTDNPFTDAYAENGYFVVVTSVSTHYFNLSWRNKFIFTKKIFKYIIKKTFKYYQKIFDKLRKEQNDYYRN